MLSFTGSVGEWLTGLDEALKSGEGLGKVTEGISNAISKVIGFVEKFVGGMSLAGEATDKLSESVSDAAKSLDEFGAKSKILEFFKTLGEVIGTAVSALGSLFGKGFGKLGEVLNSINFDRVAEIIDTLSFGALSAGIVKFIGYLKKPLEEVGSIKKSIIGVIDAVGDRFSAMEKSINAKTLLTIAGAIGILAASLLVISSIDEKQLSTALGSVTALFIELLASFAVFGKIGAAKGAGSLVLISTSLLILASAFRPFEERSFLPVFPPALVVKVLLIQKFKMMYPLQYLTLQTRSTSMVQMRKRLHRRYLRFLTSKCKGGKERGRNFFQRYLFRGSWY